MSTAVTPRYINFSELDRWDVKYFSGRIKSKYPLVSLSTFVREHNEKVRPFNFPDDTFKILGVNNTDGIFHAYDALGKEIKQPYKKVAAGDFAYNPYRINVGSIGWVPDEHEGAFISPAYVVFSIDENIILPELFWFILKSEFFNKTLRAATAGSVRMNLTYPLLETLKIPIPPMPTQKKIVEYWKKVQIKINDLLTQADQLPDELERQVLGELGLKKKKRTVMPKVMVTDWAELIKWNQRATYLLGQTPDLSKGIYPVANGRMCIEEVKHGCSASPNRKQTTLKVLKLSAVTSGEFLPDEAKFIVDRKQFRENFDLCSGDILMCRTNGTLAYVGRPVILSEDYSNLIFPDKLMRVRCKANVLPEYLEYILSSSIARPQLEANARTAVGNHAIGNEDVFNVGLPLPPIVEQKRFIDIVHKARNEIGRAKDEAVNLRRHAEKEIEKLILGTLSVEDL
jgi:type I restriction enzyme S subunit